MAEGKGRRDGIGREVLSGGRPGQGRAAPGPGRKAGDSRPGLKREREAGPLLDGAQRPVPDGSAGSLLSREGRADPGKKTGPAPGSGAEAEDEALARLIREVSRDEALGKGGWTVLREVTDALMERFEEAAGAGEDGILDALGDLFRGGGRAAVTLLLTSPGSDGMLRIRLPHVEAAVSIADGTEGTGAAGAAMGG